MQLVKDGTGPVWLVVGGCVCLFAGGCIESFWEVGCWPAQVAYRLSVVCYGLLLFLALGAGLLLMRYNSYCPTVVDDWLALRWRRVWTRLRGWHQDRRLLLAVVAKQPELDTDLLRLWRQCAWTIGAGLGWGDPARSWPNCRLALTPARQAAADYNRLQAHAQSAGLFVAGLDGIRLNLNGYGTLRNPAGRQALDRAAFLAAVLPADPQRLELWQHVAEQLIWSDSPFADASEQVVAGYLAELNDVFAKTGAARCAPPQGAANDRATDAPGTPGGGGHDPGRTGALDGAPAVRLS